MKITIFFLCGTKQIYTKPLAVSKSTLKLKVMSPQKICLSQQLFENKIFCMKIRLCDNFKTTNAMTLIKVILESPFMSSVALTNPKAMRHEYLKTTRTFFTGSSVFNYPQRLNCYDFPITFINQTNYIFSFQISVD